MGSPELPESVTQSLAEGITVGAKTRFSFDKVAHGTREMDWLTSTTERAVHFSRLSPAMVTNV